MASPSGSDATIVVIEMEPGWAYVKIIDPKPAQDRIELLLRRTIDHWFGDHPQFVIDRTEAVADNGTMQGIHVWYHVNDRLATPVNPTPRPPSTPLTIEVHDQILKQLPKEHIEAVVDEAVHIWLSHENRRDTLVVINSRQIAVLLDTHANRGAVLPVRFVEPVFDPSVRARFQTWLESLPTRFFVMHIPGSWFVSHAFATNGIGP